MQYDKLTFDARFLGIWYICPCTIDLKKKLSTLNWLFLILEITNYCKGLNHLVFNQILNLFFLNLPVLYINVLLGSQTSAFQNVAALNTLY